MRHSMLIYSIWLVLEDFCQFGSTPPCHQVSLQDLGSPFQNPLPNPSSRSCASVSMKQSFVVNIINTTLCYLLTLEFQGPASKGEAFRHLGPSQYVGQSARLPINTSRALAPAHWTRITGEYCVLGCCDHPLSASYGWRCRRSSKSRHVELGM
jgi:hypothetical protein